MFGGSGVPSTMEHCSDGWALGKKELRNVYQWRGKIVVQATQPKCVGDIVRGKLSVYPRE